MSKKSLIEIKLTFRLGFYELIKKTFSFGNFNSFETSHLREKKHQSLTKPSIPLIINLNLYESFTLRTNRLEPIDTHIFDPIRLGFCILGRTVLIIDFMGFFCILKWASPTTQ